MFLGVGRVVGPSPFLFWGLGLRVGSWDALCRAGRFGGLPRTLDMCGKIHAQAHIHKYLKLKGLGWDFAPLYNSPQ